MTFNSQILIRNTVVCAQANPNTKQRKKETGKTLQAPTYDFKNNNKGNFFCHARIEVKLVGTHHTSVRTEVAEISHSNDYEINVYFFS